MKPRRALLLTTIVALVLCAACGVWLHKERQQYARSRALIAALTHSDTKTALALVNAGADTNTRFESPPAPTLPQLFKQLLHHAPLPANDSPTAFMMACGAYWHTDTPDGLRWVTCEENLPLLQVMLAHGANVHLRETSHRTALSLAIAIDRLRTAELLLKHGADINAPDAQGLSPLMLTVWNPNLQAARLLLSQGANPNAQDRAGNSVLGLTLLVSHDRKLLTELMAHGADPNLCDKNGHTPLQLAHSMKRPDLVRLLERGAGR